jgi:hypothetical protein
LEDKSDICCNYFQEFEAKEHFITNHFIHLHGILQNSEQKLKDKLLKERTIFQKYFNEFTKLLRLQEEKLLSAITVSVMIIKINYSFSHFPYLTSYIKLNLFVLYF